MGCTKSLNVSVTGDNPMDAAVYEPSTGFIFAVQSQWVHKFNAVTGALIASMRFCKSATGPSCITALNGILYIGVSWTPLAQDTTGGPGPGFGTDFERDIFKVDAATFTVLGALGLIPWGTLDIFTTGYRLLNNDGVRIAGFTYVGGGGSVGVDTTGAFDFDPTNIVPTFHRSTVDFLNDMCYDSFNNVYWFADSEAPEISCVSTDPIFDDYTYSNDGVTHPYGVTYNSATNKVYAVQGDNTLVMAHAADAVPGFNNFDVTTFDMDTTGANPFRIKSCNDFPSNPFNGKVLIPTWDSDQVLVWDPSTDDINDMVTITGFSTPWDIVHAPTASFAVQNAGTGLKIITAQ